MINTIYRNENLWKFLARTIVSFSFIILFSCNKDDIEAETINNSVEIKIDNENLKITSNSTTSNENCEGLFISSRYETDTNIGFRLEFWLNKNGALKNIRLIDYKNNNAQFESADFNPKALFSITNFNYDASKQQLHFDFKGELLEIASGNELDIDKKRKKIEGTVNIKNVTEKECNSYFSNLNFETTNLKFLTNTTLSNYNSERITNPYAYSFYSDNGYRIIFKSKTGMWDLNKGTYSFDSNSIENRIDLEKFIGNFRATQLLFVREIDWKKYQTKGSYTITNHEIINGLKVTSGQFNLEVSDNATLIYNIANVKFEIVGF